MMNKPVEAIVLAGGKGTRLAPLTEDTPKPLLKILGKTVLEIVFDRLIDCGVRKASVTTMYLPWQIEALGSSYGTLQLNYIREQTPLGTAGAVKNAYSGDSDTVIVLSGDGVFDFDLKKALEFHYEKNADVTIVTYATENPLEYGVVLYDSEGKINHFAEKPPWAQVVSGMVNTGIYIIDKKIFDRIPGKTEYDFAKQLFPLLLAQKYAMYAYEAHGAWHDIGNLDSYFTTNCEALDGNIRGIKNSGLSQKELQEKNIEVETPVFVSKNAIIGQNVKLGAYTVIGDNAVVSDNCDIACSIIGDGAVLGMGCGVYGTLIGRGTKLGENCVTSEGCAIGANTTAEDSVIFPKYAFVHSAAHIAGNDRISGHTSAKERVLFGEDGIKCDINETDPEHVMRIGYSAAIAASSHKSKGMTRVGVMCDSNSQSERVASILLSGIQWSGVRSVKFGYGFEAMARFAALEFITDIVIYVNRSSDGDINIKIFDEYGLESSETFERKLSRVFFGPDEYTSPDRYYETDTMENVWFLYYSELVKECKNALGVDTLENFVCSFSKEHDVKAFTPEYTAIWAITELGGKVISYKEKAKCNFNIDNSGLEMNCVFPGGKLDDVHIGALLLSFTNPTNKSAVTFSCNAPEALKMLAKNKGYALAEYANSTERKNKLFSKQVFRQNLFLNDGVFKALRFAILLNSNNMNIENLANQLPDFEIYSKKVEGNEKRASVMHRLAKLSNNDMSDTTRKEESSEGIKLVMPNGSVTVIPGKISGFKIISEAKSVEAAKELCEKAEEYLK